MLLCVRAEENRTHCGGERGCQEGRQTAAEYVPEARTMRSSACPLSLTETITLGTSRNSWNASARSSPSLSRGTCTSYSRGIVVPHTRRSAIVPVSEFICSSPRSETKMSCTSPLSQLLRNGIRSHAEGKDASTVRRTGSCLRIRFEALCLPVSPNGGGMPLRSLHKGVGDGSLGDRSDLCALPPCG